MKITEDIKISNNGFVFNPKTGYSFSLNPVALEIVRYIAEERDFESIRQEMLGKYDVDELTFEKDYFEFYAQLKYHQIVVQGNPLDFN